MISIARAGEPSAVTDRDARHLALSFRAVAGVAMFFAVVEMALAVVATAPQLVMLAALGSSVGLWLLQEAGRITGTRLDASIVRLAVVVLCVLPVAALIQPAVATAVALATLIPVVLGIVYLERRVLGRLMIVAGISGIACLVLSRYGAAGTAGTPPIDAPFLLGVVALFAGYALLFTFLWAVSGRLRDVARDLTSVVAMSRDLSQTLDPMLVGDSIASHIARAVGADECGVNYHDPEADLLHVHGYFPAHRRGAIAPSYSPTSYPATRRAMADQVPYLASVADPAADRDEVAFLEAIGMASIAIVPIVAAGRTVGVVELTSSRPDAFAQRELDLAAMLARDAAMALENARLYDKVHHQAFHDGLTGLPGRLLFRERLGEALAREGTSGNPLTAVLFIDLDDFKQLNDRLGHATGDALLVAVGERLARSIRGGDVAARLGGDEFAVLLTDLTHPTEAEDVAERLLATLCRPYRLGERSAHIAASIGIDVSEGRATSMDDLLRNADVAMYAAKSSGTGLARFDPALRDAAAERIRLSRELEGAGDRGELQLDYQPIVELSSGRITGVEALLRWQPSGRPLLMPSAFIDVAESTGAILSIGRWVLREACRSLRGWQTRFDLPDLEVSVNLTASQFEDPGVVAWVAEALAETGVSPECLTLEITESGLMDNTPLTVARLTELRRLGVRVAIDDFGTGYSSLSYLERFPVDILKIDRSFVSGHDGDGGRSVLAPAVVDLARRLGLAVVAEGIETEEQAAWIRSIGCDHGQGYLFARPLGPVALEAALAADGSAAGLSGTRARQPGDRAPERVASRAARRSRGLRLVSGA